MAETVRGVDAPLYLYPGYEPGDLAIFSRFKPTEATPEAGFITDFLGTKTRSEFGTSFAHLSGKKIPPPIPGDFHSETVEWIGLLKSVLRAKHSYRLLELGAGWGPWMAAGYAAAKANQIPDIKVYGVEPDPRHIGFIRQHMADNMITPSCYEIIAGVAGAKSGTINWPVSRDAAEDYGQRSMSDKELAFYGKRFDGTMSLPVIDVTELLSKEALWNCVHIDIQGHESEVCTAGIESFNKSAQWVIIGTHSRAIEGALVNLFHSAGWDLVHEKPCRFKHNRARPSLVAMTSHDGTQVWRNPRLLA